MLVGDADDVMLASPIILEEHPQIAPESQGDLFDATEIDEILSLRTLTLTDEEKAEARATDPRAAAVIDRVDSMPGEILERLHGAIRTLRPRQDDTVPTFTEPDAPWWDPGADASVSPGDRHHHRRRRGDRQGQPGSSCVPRVGADAQDMFLDGKIATVEAVLFDVDGGHHLAVTLDDDPGADIAPGAGPLLLLPPRRGDAARETRRCWSPGAATCSSPTTASASRSPARLLQTDLPEGVVVRDTGIRGVHLVYELLDGWDTVIIVDASPRGEAPGTISLIEPDPDGDPADATLLDAHSMNPDAVLAMVRITRGRDRSHPRRGLRAGRDHRTHRPQPRGRRRGRRGRRCRPCPHRRREGS